MTTGPAYRAPIPPIGGPAPRHHTPAPPAPWDTTSPQDRVARPEAAPRPVLIPVARKSLFLAAVLPTFLGPLGLLYASPLGAVLAVLFVGLALANGIFLGFLAWFFLWPFAAAWSVFAASRHNARARALVAFGATGSSVGPCGRHHHGPAC